MTNPHSIFLHFITNEDVVIYCKDIEDGMNRTNILCKCTNSNEEDLMLVPILNETCYYTGYRYRGISYNLSGYNTECLI